MTGDMHTVFVYGSLLSNLHNHYLLTNSIFLGEHTAPGKYTMRSLGGFPGVFEGGDTEILGELYRVSDVELSYLDNLEGHPHFYERKQYNLNGVKAWMYVLPDDEYAHCPLVNGDWRAYVNGTGG